MSYTENTCKLFIDESSHLEHDDHYNMCIGYIKVLDEDYAQLHEAFKSIQLHYHSPFELKWNKFSKSRLKYYKALVDYFFASSLQFRCVLVKPKNRLDHNEFNQGSNDNFYYKMIYYLVKPNYKYKNCDLFLDIKDTRGKQKLDKIKEVLSYKFRSDSPFQHLQHLRSEDNVFIQLADFFIGAVSYKSRITHSEDISKVNENKKIFIKYLEDKPAISFSLWEMIVQ